MTTDTTATDVTTTDTTSAPDRHEATAALLASLRGGRLVAVGR